MKDLLYKEFKLFWNPFMFLFLLFGTFLLFPSWPFFIAFEYIFIAVMVSFQLARANQDVMFSVSLPVRKSDTVLARVYVLVIMEVLQIIAAIPFAVMNNTFYLKGNLAGMNTNFAFFGLIFIMYAIFNIVLLPGFYKTGYKVGIPMLVAVIVSNVFIVAANITVMMVPILNTNLNGLGASHFECQLPVLLAGIVLFVLSTLPTYKISAGRFEKVDI